MNSHDIADLAIIGSGSAAFAAAITARKQGLSVVMVEAGTVGGTCVNTGCVPSKALLAAASARHTARESRFTGVPTNAGPIDWQALKKAKDNLVADMRAEKYTDLAADYDWDIVPGTATFTGTPETPVLEVALNEGGTQRIEARHYLVATGATAWAPPIPGLADAGYLTSTTAMDLDALPQSMIVIGGNAVGLEQTQLFARLGVTITVIETLDRLAPFEEPEISQVIEDVFTSEGITVNTSATIGKIRRYQGMYTVEHTGHDGTVRISTAEQLLVATGRRPNTTGLALDTIGVDTGKRGEVVVDEHLRSTNPRIWAAGDVTGHPQFVYTAGKHGAVVVDNAFNDARRNVDYRQLPRVTFTSPAIASIGLTDEQAIEAGYTCDCRTLPLEYVPRAIVERDTTGLVKLVADAETGRLLGAHVIAEGAGDIILAAVYALDNEMTVNDLAEAWCPYLTMAEAIKLAAQAYTTDVTKLSCCAA